ncbi:phospho-N-acetylmuramoyl-pentapeptide-transferase [Synechocystis sp. LEGE 06083]|uniref:phospho-N-acetylmuramoyl-pentapeptide- transferase n=1 Tax=Synechocystis sp. LEGE 06083 TaxID=915336 RepID=UPI00188296DF|nr:phospho-N-acetylmuramoyl-pentapeptide-transferase [Synechocystis sp. LEGE 06083]MBE9195633.1 phospho-N-acetylmuramoyl-pentapeptide-transferase [Synechocystis sp. LEGE 06083]
MANAKSSSLPSWKNPSGKTLLILLWALALALMALLSSWAGLPWLGNGKLLIALGFTALVTALIGMAVVPMLVNLKASQVIQSDGPQSHLKKAGTPTMGGIFFIPVAVAIAVVGTQFNPDVMVVALVTLGYMAIGWVDDWQILKYKSNKGLTPKQKLFLQVAIAVIFCAWLFFYGPTDITNIRIMQFVLPLGFLFWLVATFALVAESNATNLTDGVDGLAAGTGAIAFVGLGLLVAKDNPALAFFCCAMAGGCIGFVHHNHNPARVFMGDTGSLALGGSLAAVGIMTGNLWGLLLISGIFLAESLSVIAQVGYYKATKGPDGVGKRLLKMAPIHHHLELSGWTETQIVGSFYLINTLLAIVAMATV